MQPIDEADFIVPVARTLAAALQRRAIEKVDGNSPLLRDTARLLCRVVDALARLEPRLPGTMDETREAEALRAGNPASVARARLAAAAAVASRAKTRLAKART